MEKLLRDGGGGGALRFHGQGLRACRLGAVVVGVGRWGEFDDLLYR